jgi:hypothetical protein
MNVTLRNPLLFTAMLILLCACDSGGGGIGGGVGGSGIRDTDVAIGNVTSFGSVFINERRFDTSDAQIFVKGRSANESDLRVGMVVTAAVSFDSQLASRIEYLPQVVGPVSAVDFAASSFEIFGLTVLYNGNVMYDGLTAGDIAPGVVLEVSGYLHQSGTIDATFIRMSGGNDDFLVQGFSSIRAGGAGFGQSSINVQVSGQSISVDSGLVTNQSVLVSISVSNQSTLSSRISYAAPSIEYSQNRSIEITDYVTVDPVGRLVSTSRLRLLTNDETVIQHQDGQLASIEDIKANTRLIVSGSVLEVNGLVLAERLLIVK